MKDTKDILVVIDCQHDFVDGVLGTDRAKEIMPAINDRIHQYSENGKWVVYTMDSHDKNYLDTVEGKHLQVEHCNTTDGWKLCVDLAERSQLMYKETFGSVELGEYFKDFEGEVEMCGVCTGICVLANFNMIKAFNPNIEVYINEPLCACVTEETHKNAIAAMQLQHANIME